MTYVILIVHVYFINKLIRHMYSYLDFSKIFLEYPVYLIILLIEFHVVG